MILIIIIINEKYVLTHKLCSHTIPSYTRTQRQIKSILLRENYENIFAFVPRKTHFGFPFSFHIAFAILWICMHTEVIIYVCRRLCLSSKWSTEFNCYMAFGRVFWLSGFSRVRVRTSRARHTPKRLSVLVHIIIIIVHIL